MPEGKRGKKHGQKSETGWKRRQSHSTLEEVSEPGTQAQAGPMPVGAVLSEQAPKVSEVTEAPPAPAPAPEEIPVPDEAVPDPVEEKPLPAAPVAPTAPAAPAAPAAPVVPAAPAASAAPAEVVGTVGKEEPAPPAAEPLAAWVQFQEKARCQLARTRVAVEHAQLKAKTLAQDPHLRYSAVGASAGAAIVGAGGAATGLTTGSLLGAAVGVIPAVFTFGLSIPFCAAVGGGAGLAVGAASGATAGALAGGATGYQAYNHRHEIRASASKTLEQVTTSADFVKARANAATSFLSERATVARARLMGGGTGGTEAHD